MAPGLTRPHPAGGPGEGGAGAATSRAELARRALLVLSVLLLLVVGLSRPNAAQPDLAPRGWAPGALLPFTLSPGAVTGVLWAGYLVGAVAVVLGLRRGAPALRWWAPGLLAVASLLVAPFGSADHVSYVAYGRILVSGGNPWVESPAGWAGGADPVTSRVEAPWTEEPSVYGPAGTLLHALAAWVGGPSLRQEVWVWQVVVVLAWLGTRVALRVALPERLHGRVDVAWAANPLVLGVGVLGAHVDVVATAFVVAAVALTARRAGAAGAAGTGALVAAAASTKVTYGVALVAVLAAWWAVRGDGPMGRRRALGRCAATVLGFVVAAGALHVWAGAHVYDQLSRSRQAVSLATPWRPFLEAARGPMGEDAARLAISVGAALLAVVLAVLLLRATRPDPSAAGGRARWAATALWLTASLSLAYSLAAPYSLPWYDLLVWAALPAVVAGPVDLVATARLLVMSLAYVPGRVLGMTPAVESLTLGLRRSVSPWLELALWLAVLALGLRGVAGRGGSGRSSAPPPAGTPPTPTR
ncbi:hypothetical protein [Phycicoccus sonneratiae]|uniref:DUF2029 domain-containing protein n=1 Tax=Phycicoccus sonneratiae TaxID=2807628 RepID=A0ABS2CPB0_9MICO|nr:hypothetical protein [Phycicoccus sonneraticus]MBM6401727.1 hypothetical protein [Phycicoccus sonneraticus]